MKILALVVLGCLAAVVTGQACTGVCPLDEITGNCADGNYPHSTDCKKYCACVDCIGIEQSCPGDLIFDPILNMCNWAEVVDCTQRECPRTVTNITTTYLYANWGQIWGAWMKDNSVSSTDSRVWVLDGLNSDTLYEFSTELDYTNGNINRTISLPNRCEGTGHVMYQSTIYCNVYASRFMMAYNVDSAGSMIAELANVGVESADDYDWGSKYNEDTAWGRGAYMDFAVDEYGLWVIYSNIANNNNIIVSKLNDTLVVTNTSNTNFPKSSAGNAFVVCGVLYVLDSSFGDFNDVSNNNYIRYMFDLTTGDEFNLATFEIPFPTVDRNCMVGTNSVSTFYSHLTYSPQDEKLYAWNCGYHERIDVVFDTTTYKVQGFDAVDFMAMT